MRPLEKCQKFNAQLRKITLNNFKNAKFISFPANDSIFHTQTLPYALKIFWKKLAISQNFHLAQRCYTRIHKQPRAAQTAGNFQLVHILSTLHRCWPPTLPFSLGGAEQLRLCVFHFLGSFTSAPALSHTGSVKSVVFAEKILSLVLKAGALRARVHKAHATVEQVDRQAA